ncbi:MAG: UDP-N-acetylglucosamine--LPS N-acetylglucosamine transferase [Peptococcaceae bacterium]|nr:UDP-N-acetylglucosamine--LPS N-acetylglucosamine transferase [Peptococcaceae bacterium]
MKPLRVLVFSASFGDGHFKAAEGLIQALKRTDSSIQIMHEDFMSIYNKMLNSIIKNMYIKMIKRVPKLYGTFYQSTQNLPYDSRFQRFINSLGHKRLMDYIYSLDPDIIICTYPTISGLLAELRTLNELRLPLVTVITDYSVHSQWIHPGVDLYIVGCTQVRDGLIERGINPQSIQVTGIPVSPKFDRLLSRKDTLYSLGLTTDRLTFLIMGGAYGVLGNAKWMCKLIASADAPVQAIFVCGKDRRLYHSLDSVLTEAKNPVVRFHYVNNIDELMSAADVIITKAGGLTVSEALTKHLPMVIFKPIPGQEESNAHYIEEIGAGKIANNQQEFLNIFNQLIQNENLISEMRDAAAREYPGNSAKRAVESILGLAYKFRNVKPAVNSKATINPTEGIVNPYI